MEISQALLSLDERKILLLLQEMIAGREFDTGHTNLAEFLWQTASRVEGGLGTLPLCSSVERILNDTRLAYFLNGIEQNDRRYQINEFFRLASFCQSTGIARTLFRKRILSKSEGTAEIFDAAFSAHLVRATRENCHDSEVANQAIALSKETFYMRYVGNLFFSLLELSPEKSTQLVPAFVTHYFGLEDESVRVVYQKNLQFLFSNQDIGNYVDRLSSNLGKSFWSILIRTDLSRRLFAVPKEGVDPSLDDGMPQSELVVFSTNLASPYKATSAENDIKILRAQVSEAAQNPQGVRERFDELKALIN
jgi:hypothetical protein